MSDDTSISASRTINAPAKDIFDVLSNPERHAELDGSGFIRSDQKTNRIQKVGDVFTMNMEADHMGGEYQTDNHVIGYDQNKLLAWKTAPKGVEPPGWKWVWELTPVDAANTDVSITYDWSEVTDKELLQKVKFPIMPVSGLEDSLVKLAEAVGR